jgi:ATP-dependent DNA ligase
LLHHVGFTSNIPTDAKPAVTKQLEKLVKPPGFTGQAPGGPSRWSTARSAEWQPLAPKLVVEVQYDHFSGGRFRHGTSFLRWRPDKPPRRCTLAQVEQEGRSALKLLAR